MTIPLPPLPEPEIESKQIDSVMRVYTIRSHSVDQVRAIQREAMRVAIEAAARVLTEHQIPVGNSRAGEMARDWTYDALKECRDAIRNLEIGT